MNRLQKRTCNHFLKTIIYITRNIRLQNVQGGGNPHLLQEATFTQNNPHLEITDNQNNYTT